MAFYQILAPVVKRLHKIRALALKAERSSSKVESGMWRVELWIFDVLLAIGKDPRVSA